MRTASALALLILLAASAPLTAQHPARRDQARPVRVVADVRPDGDGEAAVLVVRLVHAPGAHSWPNQPVVPPELAGLRPIATRVVLLSASRGVTAEEAVWPAPVTVEVNYGDRPIRLLALAGVAEVKLPLTLAPRARGPISGTVAVSYQPCDYQFCYPPRTDTIPFRAAPRGGASAGGPAGR